MEPKKTFHDLVAAFEKHIEDDLVFHKKVCSQLETLNKTNEELSAILSGLTFGKKAIIGAALIIGSIVGIGMGLKAILTWFR